MTTNFDSNYYCYYYYANMLCKNYVKCKGKTKEKVQVLFQVCFNPLLPDWFINLPWIF